MSIINDIRATLDNHLTTDTFLPTSVYPNLNFKTDGSPYIKVDFNPISIRAITRGDQPIKRYDGFYNLLICTPENTGSGAGLEYAAKVLDLFDTTTDVGYYSNTWTLTQEDTYQILQEDTFPISLDSDLLYVTIEYSEISGSPYLDTPFYCTPVRVKWFTHSIY